MMWNVTGPLNHTGSCPLLNLFLIISFPWSEVTDPRSVKSDTPWAWAEVPTKSTQVGKVSSHLENMSIVFNCWPFQGAGGLRKQGPLSDGLVSSRIHAQSKVQYRSLLLTGTVMAVARSALVRDAMLLCPRIASISAITALSSWAHYASTVVTNDCGWLTSPLLLFSGVFWRLHIVSRPQVFLESL